MFSFFFWSSSYLPLATSNASEDGNAEKCYGFHQLPLHSFGSQLLIRWFHGIYNSSLYIVNGSILSQSRSFFVQVLSLHETLVAYKSVYFIGTVVPIAVILLSYLVPVKPVRPKTRKEE